MPHLLLIGAGNQGLLHLRALMKIQVPCDVSVVDLSDAALLNANGVHKRFSLEGQVGQFRLYHSLGDIDSEVDIALVATHADARRSVVEQMLRQTVIRHLVLEPMLFQAKADFEAMIPLLARNKVQTWMHNARFYYPIYDEVRKFFKPGEPVELQVHGGEWGLGARSIDFLDLLSRILGNFEWLLDLRKIASTPVYNYRKGSMELKGAMEGRQGESRFHLLEYEGESPLVLQFKGQHYSFQIHEAEGRAMWGQRLKDFSQESLELTKPFSGLVTERICQDLLNQGKCRLSRLEQVADLHVQLNEEFRLFVEKAVGKHFAYCPMS